jgi:hypothetical protein
LSFLHLEFRRKKRIEEMGFVWSTVTKKTIDRARERRKQMKKKIKVGNRKKE